MEYTSQFLSTLAARGFIHQATDASALDALFTEAETAKKPLVAYIGFDCTASSLHVGSLLQIMALRWLQQCGHKPIVLMGGGTTKIGDPSGKDESRKLLDDAAIEANKQGIKQNFLPFLSFEDTFDANTTHAYMVDNAEWIDKLNYSQFLRDVGRHFSVNRMLSMDSVKMRLEREHHLSFLEFNYMVLQAYDFYHLGCKTTYNCRLQIGGADQWGNIVAGTEFFSKRSLVDLEETILDIYHKQEEPVYSSIEKIIDIKMSKSGWFTKLIGNSRESYVNESVRSFANEKWSSLAKEKGSYLFGLTTPLITTSSGAKMGKTTAGAVWLNPEMLAPYLYWQFWRNTEDADVGRFLRYFTDLPLEEIARLEALEGAGINEAKKILATEATALLHGRATAEQARDTAQKVFEEGTTAAHLPEVTLSATELAAGIPAFKLFHMAGLAASGGEARRLIQGGGAKVDDVVVTSDTQVISATKTLKLSAGKKKHILVKLG